MYDSRQKTQALKSNNKTNKCYKDIKIVEEEKKVCEEKKIWAWGDCVTSFQLNFYCYE